MNVSLKARPVSYAEINARAYVRNTLMASQAYQTGETAAAKILDQVAVSYLNQLTPTEQTYASKAYARAWETWRDSGFDLQTYVLLIVGLF